MKRKLIFTAFIALFISLSSFGQKYVLRGIVRDSVNNTSLEGVVAMATSPGTAEKAFAAGISDVRGRFELSLPAGRYLVVLKMLGYSPVSWEINLSSSLQQEFLMSPQHVNLGEVEVTSLVVNRQVKKLPAPVVVVESSRYKKLSALTLSNVLATEPEIGRAHV